MAMKKCSVLVSILIMIFISACVAKETMKGEVNLLSYENKDLGISFKYPSTFKVYQGDKDTLRIDTDYKNTQHSAVEAVMGIRRINAGRESIEQIHARINPDLSGITSIIQSLEQSISPEGRAELTRQIEYVKRTNPDGYKLSYGNKTIEEATEEHVKTIQTQIEKFREMQTKKKTFKVENKGNYDLVNVENGQSYYLLSDKGTFIIDNTIDIEFWKPLFEQDGVYQEYKNQFDQIKNSIKII